ncbi:MAG: ABC transporter permease [Acidobacteriaceae bacterium]|nr:ABC transporter permease [Acidobacteriaceae bacterium]
MFDSLWPDLRFAGRMLRRNAGFTAIAIVTLAVGIGANTAIFSVIDHTILRPLAYRDPDRLYAIHEKVLDFPQAPPLLPVNAMHFLEWRKNVRAFDSVALMAGYALDLTGSGEPRRLHAARVSWNLFKMLGVQPQLGRSFRPHEDQPGHDHEVIIDNALWRRHFAGDPNVIGRKIVLDGNPYEVIGVLPANFRFPKLSQLYAMAVSEERPEIWKPFALRNDELDDMGDFNFACIARLKPGVSRGRALAELNAAQGAFVKKLPEKADLRAELVPLESQIVGRSRTGLELILVAVGAVLLIACVNIANLLLTRSTVRSREMAIRTALGAGRGRLLRQLLMESLTLAGAGGILGIGIAYAAIRLIVAKAPVDLPRLDEVHLDLRVLLFTAVISVFCGLLFGVLPAWNSARRDPQEAMKGGGRGTTAGRTSGRLRSLLVSAEICLSTMSLAAGALLLHSFVNLLNVDKGFDVQRLVTVDLSLPRIRYPDNDAKALFLQQMLQRVEALPGVLSAGTINRLPLSGEGGNNLILVEGSNLPILQRPLADIRQVNPDYFRTMAIPLRQGRTFTTAEYKRQVAMISASAAAKLWPKENPVGRRFRMGGDERPFLQVVGVVGDVRGTSLGTPPSPTVYVPYWVQLWGEPTLVVRTALAPAAASGEIRGVLRQMDRQMPVERFQTMEEVLDQSVAQRRFQMNLVLLFAVSALLLACLGIYGVVSYSVAQRTNEIGVRMTLGARSGDISRMVLWQGLMPVISGLSAGVLASFITGRIIASLLFGVTSADPIAMAAVVAALTTVAACATLIPAMRATRVDPAIALRYE